MSTFDLYSFVYGKTTNPKRSPKIHTLYPHERLLWFKQGPCGLSSTLRGAKVLKAPSSDFSEGFVLAEHLYYKGKDCLIIGRSVVPVLINLDGYRNRTSQIKHGSHSPVLEDVSLGDLRFTLVKHPTARCVVIKDGDSLIEFEIPRGAPSLSLKR